MKKSLLLALLLFLSVQVFAQCQPNPQHFQQKGVFPGTFNVPLNQALLPTVLTVTVKRDTVFPLFSAGQTFQVLVKFTDVSFDSVSGFPVGLPAGSDDKAQAASIYSTASPSLMNITFDTTSNTPMFKGGCLTLVGTAQGTSSTYNPKLIASTEGWVYLPEPAVRLLNTGFPPMIQAPCPLPTSIPNPFRMSNVPACFANNAIIGNSLKPILKGLRELGMPMELRTNSTTGIEGLRDNYDFSIYPNPVTVDSRINFTLQNVTDVQIELLDVTGKVLSTLANSKLAAGTHSMAFANEELVQGVYMVRATIGGTTAVTKVVVR
jgi:hypothetical protein